MDNSKVNSIRERLEGNWDLVEKHGFSNNTVNEPVRLNFGKYLDYTKGVFPKSLNIYYVKKRPGRDRDEHSFYIFNSPFDRDPGILLKIIKLNKDTLIFGMPREFRDTVIMYSIFKRAK